MSVSSAVSTFNPYTNAVSTEELCVGLGNLDPVARDPDHVEQLAVDYKRHGFCVIKPCVPTELTDALFNKMTHRASILPANRGDGRTCFNDVRNILYKEWFDMLAWLVDEQSPTAKVLNHVFGDAWWFDRCGGDGVRGEAGFASPCLPHSDWKGVPDAVVSVSIFLHDVSVDHAPMQLWSNPTGKCYTGAAKRSSILIRCVDVIHSGTENRELGMRLLPAYRFVTSAALRKSWEPRGFISDEVYATFTPVLATKCIFLRNLTSGKKNMHDGSDQQLGDEEP